MPTVKLTTQDFKDNIFTYEIEKIEVIKGFTSHYRFMPIGADLCKMVAPSWKNYLMNTRVNLVIYKVDTEKELELAGCVWHTKYPHFLFIPAAGEPMMQPGAFPKKVFKEVIDDTRWNSHSWCCQWLFFQLWLLPEHAVPLQYGSRCCLLNPVRQHHFFHNHTSMLVSFRWIKGWVSNFFKGSSV